MSNKSLKLTDESGFTLIEMLAALILTGFLSVALVQITNQATNSVSKIGNSAVTVQSAIRFSNVIKYDFSGSQDVYIHSNTQPVQGNNKSCTTFTPAANTWSSPTGISPYVRGLFTLRVAEVNYSTNAEEGPKWQSLTPVWVGYEIRQSAYPIQKTLAPDYELWRVFCDDKSGSPSTPVISKSERLLNLGNVLNPTVLTDQYMKCFDDIPNSSGSITTNVVDCRAGATGGYDATTASRVDYYKFELPYLGSKVVLNKLRQDEFQLLRRRIDN